MWCLFIVVLDYAIVQDKETPSVRNINITFGPTFRRYGSFDKQGNLGLYKPGTERKKLEKQEKKPVRRQVIFKISSVEALNIVLMQKMVVEACCLADSSGCQITTDSLFLCVMCDSVCK